MPRHLAHKSRRRSANAGSASPRSVVVPALAVARQLRRNAAMRGEFATTFAESPTDRVRRPLSQAGPARNPQRSVAGDISAALHILAASIVRRRATCR